MSVELVLLFIAIIFEDVTYFFYHLISLISQEQVNNERINYMSGWNVLPQ